MNLPLVPDIGYHTPGSLGTWGDGNGISVITLELPPLSVSELTSRYVEPLRRLLSGKIDE